MFSYILLAYITRYYIHLYLLYFHPSLFLLSKYIICLNHDLTKKAKINYFIKLCIFMYLLLYDSIPGSGTAPREFSVHARANDS